MRHFARAPELLTTVVNHVGRLSRMVAQFVHHLGGLPMRRAILTLALLGLAARCVSAQPAPAEAPVAPPEAPKLALTLLLDKAAYALGDEAYAEVRLENASDSPVSVAELQLEARSVTIELVYNEKLPAIRYTVNRPGVPLNARAGPTRVPLAPHKALIAVIPVPLVRSGKVAATAVYPGPGGAAARPAGPVRSNTVSADVKADAGKELVARLETTYVAKDAREGAATGVITVGLYAEEAPVHAMNFLALARQGFYDGQPFFRVIADFAIQAGCPLGSGYGDPGYHIANERKAERRHVRGAVSMSHPEGKPAAAGSQFFICVKEAPWLDIPGYDYTVFGHVVDGLECADGISQAAVDPKSLKPLQEIRIKGVTVGMR